MAEEAGGFPLLSLSLVRSRLLRFIFTTFALVTLAAIQVAAIPSIATAQTGQSPRYASEILDLANWKLQLPIGTQGSVTEIKQPALATYSSDPYFLVTSSGNGNGVQFRAPVNGVTTSGSSYPRSELREMNGTANASWSTTSGTHTMYIDQAVTAVPKTKQQIVVGHRQ